MELILKGAPVYDCIIHSLFHIAENQRNALYHTAKEL